MHPRVPLYPALISHMGLENEEGEGKESSVRALTEAAINRLPAVAVRVAHHLQPAGATPVF